MLSDAAESLCSHSCLPSLSSWLDVMYIVKFPEAGHCFFSVGHGDWKGWFSHELLSMNFLENHNQIIFLSPNILNSWLSPYKWWYLDNHQGFKHFSLCRQYRWISVTASTLSPIRRSTVIGIFLHVNFVINVVLLYVFCTTAFHCETKYQAETTQERSCLALAYHFTCQSILVMKEGMKCSLHPGVQESGNVLYFKEWHKFSIGLLFFWLFSIIIG